MVAPLASVTIENFWNEKIKELTLECKTDADKYTEKEFYQIENKQILLDIYKFVFFYDKEVSWHVTFTTEKGKTWSTNIFLPAQFTEADNGKVTVGVNGDSKQMYVAFPKSGTYTAKLYQL